MDIEGSLRGSHCCSSDFPCSGGDLRCTGGNTGSKTSGDVQTSLVHAVVAGLGSVGTSACGLLTGTVDITLGLVHARGNSKTEMFTGVVEVVGLISDCGEHRLDGTINRRSSFSEPVGETTGEGVLDVVHDSAQGTGIKTAKLLDTTGQNRDSITEFLDATGRGREPVSEIVRDRFTKGVEQVLESFDPTPVVTLRSKRLELLDGSPDLVKLLDGRDDRSQLLTGARVNVVERAEEVTDIVGTVRVSTGCPPSVTTALVEELESLDGLPDFLNLNKCRSNLGDLLGCVVIDIVERAEEVTDVVGTVCVSTELPSITSVLMEVLQLLDGSPDFLNLSKRRSNLGDLLTCVLVNIVERAEEVTDVVGTVGVSTEHASWTSALVEELQLLDDLPDSLDLLEAGNDRGDLV